MVYIFLYRRLHCLTEKAKAVDMPGIFKVSHEVEISSPMKKKAAWAKALPKTSFGDAPNSDDEFEPPTSIL